MRTYGTRLCCDACEGIFLTDADFASSIDELIRMEPTLDIQDRGIGDRLCPRCRAPMHLVHVVVHVVQKQVNVPPELDHCKAHGLWFDPNELAGAYQHIHWLLYPHLSARAGYRG
jgi:hypothetical protein